MITNQERFLQSCDKVINGEVLREGIGTLSEKTVHAVLKDYFESDPTKTEIRVGKNVADILNDQGIIEIQTKQFNRLRAKLAAFLPEFDVTVVYPVASTKMLHWVDETTGEISKGRKSPKKGTPYMIFPELYKIKSFLTNERLHFRIVLMDIDEYRLLNGWSKDKKKGSCCSDRLPTALVQEIAIHCLDDYRQFIPDGLPKQFISKEFAKAAKIPTSLAQITLNILTEVQAVNRIGKRNRSILYELI